MRMSETFLEPFFFGHALWFLKVHMGRIWKLLGCKWLPFHDVPCFCFASLTWIFCTFLMIKTSNSNIPYQSCHSNSCAICCGAAICNYWGMSRVSCVLDGSLLTFRWMCRDCRRASALHFQRTLRRLSSIQRRKCNSEKDSKSQQIQKND